MKHHSCHYIAAWFSQIAGQLRALLAGTLVALVGTSRDNDWAHLDWLQAISSSLMLCSISLLLIIRHEKPSTLKFL